MTAEPACLCSSLRRAARAATGAYDAAMQPSGLRVTQFAILRTLAKRGPLPVSRLAAEIALDRSTMGRNLDPLERRGLVSLCVCEQDGRARLATLTPAGEAAIATALPYWRAAQARVAVHVPPALVAALADGLAHLDSPIPQDTAPAGARA